MEELHCATADCSLPNVFLRLQARLSFIDQIESSKKNPRNWKFSVFVKALDDHHIKFFPWMFTLRSIYFMCKTMCCANPSRLKEESQSDLEVTVKKWSVRKPKIPQPAEVMKDNKVTSRIYVSPFSRLLVRYPKHSDSLMSSKLQFMLHRTFQSAKPYVFRSIFGDIFDLNVSTFIKKKKLRQRQFQKSSLQCLSLLH